MSTDHILNVNRCTLFFFSHVPRSLAHYFRLTNFLPKTVFADKSNVQYIGVNKRLMMIIMTDNIMRWCHTADTHLPYKMAKATTVGRMTALSPYVFQHRAYSRIHIYYYTIINMKNHKNTQIKNTIQTQLINEKWKSNRTLHGVP